ncbi:hypothetical protein EIN_176320 [Entamoeba invadens IP1]|uniref:hypothetical protein n=1 Tax=Entamoeba invadens IP1 TaxID=370355 RepID=UPI0002C3E66B|nr:hypothetical protein EIN_176320 [Entamoeba invadens IP1]ELP93815.1 hypothetical protein EIN_176320 [Entamoeba invadens IP1]|eukprot:XP_004260586.1 hypothetical protein EIN_176320 [Entamoeba invadens IP1]
MSSPPIPKRVFAVSDTHLNLQLIFDVKNGRNHKKPATVPEKKQFLLKTRDMAVYGWENYIKKLKKSWDTSITQNDIVLVSGDVAMSTRNPLLDLKFLSERPGFKIIGCGNHDMWWPYSTSQKRNYQLKYKNMFFLDSTNYYKDENILVVGTKLADYRFNLWPAYSDTFEEEMYDPKIEDHRCENETHNLEIVLNTLSKHRGSLKTILMIHHPPCDQNITQNEILEMIVQAQPDYCIFGHVHSFTQLYKDPKIQTIEDVKTRAPAVNFIRGQTQFNCVALDYLKNQPMLLFSIQQYFPFLGITKNGFI